MMNVELLKKLEKLIDEKFIEINSKVENLQSEMKTFKAVVLIETECNLCTSFEIVPTYAENCGIFDG